MVRYCWRPLILVISGLILTFLSLWAGYNGIGATVAIVGTLLGVTAMGTGLCNLPPVRNMDE